MVMVVSVGEREIGLPPLNASRELSELCRHCEHPEDWHVHDRVLEPPCQIMDKPTGKSIYSSGLKFDCYRVCYCPGWEIQDGVQDLCECCDHNEGNEEEHTPLVGASNGGHEPPAPRPLSWQEALRLPAQAGAVEQESGTTVR